MFFKRKTVYIIIATIKLKLIPVIPLTSTVVLLVIIFLEKGEKLFFLEFTILFLFCFVNINDFYEEKNFSVNIN